MTHPARPFPNDAHFAPSAGLGACAHEDLRCACGSLLARRVPDGVELKCRRCKRTVVVPLEEGDQAV